MNAADLATSLTVYQREKLLLIGPDGAVTRRWAWESVQKLRKLGLMENMPVEPTPESRECFREYLTPLGQEVCALMRAGANLAA